MPVLADGGLLWVIVVVGSIIAQIIKAKKNAASSPPKGPETPSGDKGDYNASSDELRNFLASIGAAKPPAVPQQVRQPKPNVVRKPHPQPVQARRDVRTLPPPPLPAHARIKHRPSPREIEREEDRERAATHSQPPQRQESETTTTTIAKESNTLTSLIRKELKDLDATRKSIVLREILGPPIALR